MPGPAVTVGWPALAADDLRLATKRDDRVGCRARTGILRTGILRTSGRPGPLLLRGGGRLPVVRALGAGCRLTAAAAAAT